MNRYTISFLLFVMCVVSNFLHAQNYYGKSKELPLNQTKPFGWLQQVLVKQAEGLGGNPTVSGYPFNTRMWTEDIQIPVGHAGRAYWPYEQTAYFLDGTYRCGQLIKNQALVEFANQNFNHTLSHITENGILGQNKADDWARVVYFRGLMAKYEITKNQSILKKMSSHFLKTPRLFNNGRALFSIEPILWLYDKTGNEKLLNLAIHSFHKSKSASEGGEYDKAKKNDNLPSKLLDNMLSEKIPHGHGVSNMEQVKIPALLYMYTGKERYLNASINQFNKIVKHHMLVDGCPSSIEHLEGKAVDLAHETCDIIDLSWSAGYLLMATNNGHWGDLVERCIFNAGFGSMDKDFKSHQYYSAPNQPVAAEETSQFNVKLNWGGMALGRMCYRTGHDTECCTGNIQRMFPSYASRMWLKKADNSGIIAALYGSSEFNFNHKGKEIKIQQKTQYPFNERIEFRFEIEKVSKFSFTMRIPKWCSKPELYLNGKKIRKINIEKGMATIDRTFKNNDLIELQLPMETKLTAWGEKNEGFAIERGPLVYSLPVNHKIITFPYIGDPKLKDFPNKLMYPASNWNYTLDIKDITDVNVIENKLDSNTYPWSVTNSPVKIQVPAKKVLNWRLDGTKHLKKFPDKLKLSPNREYIELVPLGSTYLRMTLFPKTN
ncbi:beta-L-arabinofuranosidase domain-containing protein [Ochrovirga pacifica]|uniref:beta-L-arabinofuranosidase domain-containing protein n=1 Tax=Ochrovirga pacifica TaxID=1042376 RepID=UPI00025583DF|nr:beta-L-arabinofuranosidase domain-containing protein [Ochrovirga pacifica]